MQPGVGYRYSLSSAGLTLDIGDPWPSVDSSALNPLQAYGFRYDSGSSTILFKVYPGTINNLVPQIEDDPGNWVKLDYQSGGVPTPPEGILNTTGGLFYIYLRTGPDATSGDFPSSDTTSARYPRIICYGSTQTDTDTEGYILLAHGSVNGSNQVTCYQDVTGSLWGDRLKLGTLTARYYYARI